jgi:3-oxoacyl-[acyl-carrier protein] reductase
MNAIITGAAQGMRKAFAEELATLGHNIAICDIQETELFDVKTYLKKRYQIKVFTDMVDISNEEDIKDFVNKVKKYFGNIHILINNAAIYPLHSIEKITNEEWDLVLKINLKGYFLFVREILPIMKKEKFGRIINIASEAGKNEGTICALHYAASKGGVLAFTRNLAKQVGEYGVTVNAIAPGRIVTDMTADVGKGESDLYRE